jgi:hypothetical protein
MEIKIEIEKNLEPEDVIGILVSEENNKDLIIGEIISYDTITGIAVCELHEKGDDQITA